MTEQGDSIRDAVNGDLLAQSVHLWAVTQMSPVRVDAVGSHPGEDGGHPDHSLDWNKMGTADDGEWVTSAVGRRAGVGSAQVTSVYLPGVLGPRCSQFPSPLLGDRADPVKRLQEKATFWDVMARGGTGIQVVAVGSGYHTVHGDPLGA